jgi:hypothetical protein
MLQPGTVLHSTIRADRSAQTPTLVPQCRVDETVTNAGATRAAAARIANRRLAISRSSATTARATPVASPAASHVNMLLTESSLLFACPFAMVPYPVPSLQCPLRAEVQPDESKLRLAATASCGKHHFRLPRPLATVAAGAVTHVLGCENCGTRLKARPPAQSA